MKKFSYQATDINGKTVRGQEMAEDYQELQQKLKERNLYVTRYRDLGANDAVDVKYKFKTKEVSFISRQLASMTSAGLSLVRALYILQDQQQNKKAKRVLLVVNGKAKAQAVKDCFFGPIRPQAPGSILQLHPDFTLVADEDALSLVKDLL